MLSLGVECFVFFPLLFFFQMAILFMFLQWRVHKWKTILCFRISYYVEERVGRVYGPFILERTPRTRYIEIRVRWNEIMRTAGYISEEYRTNKSKWRNLISRQLLKVLKITKQNSYKMSTGWEEIDYLVSFYIIILLVEIKDVRCRNFLANESRAAEVA